MPNQPSKDTKRIVVSLPKEVARRVNQLAILERRSVSNYVQGLVLDALEQTPPEIKAVVKERILQELTESMPSGGVAAFNSEGSAADLEKDLELQVEISKLESSEW